MTRSLPVTAALGRLAQADVGVEAPSTDGGGAAALRKLTLDEWQRWVELHPQSTAFHHRNWIELLTRQYASESLILAAEQEGRIVAAIPLVATRSLSGKRKLVCLPFSDCVPPLATSDESLSLLAQALSAAPLRGCRAVVVRTDKPLGDAPCDRPHVRHTIDTAHPVDQVAKRFTEQLRRNLRKAELRGLTFERRTDREAMGVFYRLHLLTRRKLGVPVQPRGFFQRLQEAMIEAGLGFIGVVAREGKPVAAGVFLTYKRTMIYKYGASDPQALEHRPNDFLIRSALGVACEEGYASFDFGVTARSNEGLRRFKQKWGAVESDACHVCLAGAPDPARDDSRLLKAASLVIRNSPTIVCRALGEVFYRYSQ